jgi:signal transduction histidine kinase
MRAMRGRGIHLVAVVGAFVAIVLGGQAILQWTPFELHRTVTPESRVLTVLLNAVWLFATIVVLVRQPDSRLPRLIVLWVAAQHVWVVGYLPVDPRALIDVPVYLLGEMWAAVFVHLVVAFPSGRLADRFDRRLVTFVYATALGVKVIAMLVEPEPCFAVCDNPVPLLPSTTLWDITRFSALALVPLIFGASILELLRHHRRAGPGGRRAIAPMLIAAPIFLVAAFAGYVADALLDEAARDATHSFNVVGIVGDLAVPIAIMVGALQTRLARGNVADLAVELGRGVPIGGLRTVLARALRDPSLELAFPAPSGHGLVDSDGTALATPDPRSRAVTTIERDGQVLAVFIGDPAIVADDPGLLDAVGAVARMAIDNERLSAQVRAQLEEVRLSRERVVAAADEERRRVERDLHDGAQQRLVALAMRLDLAREGGRIDDATIADASAELRSAIAEVRDLARGLHPTILGEAGLGPAIEALAERTALPVTVRAPARRFPATIESAAYFVIAEALTNITRYAGATHVRVDIEDDGDHLSVAIRDDGLGGADPGRGSGLHGLTDRVAAVGGRFEIDSPIGGGTTVRVDLPLPA